MKDIEDPFNFQFSLSNNVHQEPFCSYEKKKNRFEGIFLFSETVSSHI